MLIQIIELVNLLLIATLSQILKYQDDGGGISEENLGKIFESFFTTRRIHRGTGLGLHIVYNLVTQKLKGTIHCESELNKGTTFILELPTQLIK